MMQRAQSFREPGSFPYPGVETHCIRSTGIKTIKRLEFASADGDFADVPKYVDDLDGDGFVNHHSADICENWWSDEENFHSLQLQQVKHGDIVKEEQVFNYIDTIVGLSHSAAGSCLSVTLLLVSVMAAAGFGRLF